MPTNSSLENHLQRSYPAAVRFLQELVSINSFTINAEGVNTNAQRIIEHFAPFNFQVRQEQCQLPGTGKHLILDSGGDAQAIALISHLDTVFSPQEEEQNNFHWQPDGNIVYGPGTADIKGGTVMIWMMLDALAAQDPDLFHQTRWILLFNAAEEMLSLEFGEFCLRELPQNTKACLVFEPDREKKEDFSLVNSRKGRGAFEVHIMGRNAHAGASYREGANAIHQLAIVVDHLQSLTDLDHETTVNVGKIAGGSVTNTVPAEASAALEMRSFDEAHFRKTKEAILAMNGTGEIKSANGNHACTIKIRQLSENLPWPQNPATMNLLKTWQQAAASCGYQLTSTASGGLSDGNALWDIFPTVDGLGPRGGNGHCSFRSEDGSTQPEFVDLSSFVPKALINCLAVKRVLN
ncbi:MAG: M20/M25/M40 family metallo-hydrolase [Abditibacteriaceae bacterium]